jgi:hypothetical protein
MPRERGLHEELITEAIRTELEAGDLFTRFAAAVA